MWPMSTAAQNSSSSQLMPGRSAKNGSASAGRDRLRWCAWKRGAPEIFGAERQSVAAWQRVLEYVIALKSITDDLRQPLPEEEE